MNLRTLAFLGIVALGLLLPGAAQADEKPLVLTAPVEEVFPNPCTGETITLTGEMVIREHELEDGADGYHFRFMTVPRGIEAVGASGTRYRSVGAHSDYFTAGPGRAETFSFTVAFLVVSLDGSDNFLAKATIHYTVNANGDPTAEFEEIRFECVG
jgi:hypothetical protein